MRHPDTRVGALTTSFLVAGAALASPVRGAADPADRLALRVRESAGRTDVDAGEPTRGRFRVDVSGRTAAATIASFGLRLGALSFDATLDGGRYSGPADGTTGPVMLRVRSRRHSLHATVTGRVARGAGTVFGHRCLDGLDSGDFQRTATFHGLVAAGAVVDGSAVKLAVGWTGWSDASILRTGEEQIDLALTAASVAPSARATRPVLVLTPRRAAGAWNGRTSGIAFATGAPPALSYATSGGRVRPIDAPDDARNDFGDAQAQAPGVALVILPEGAVFQRAFDVAVQSPAGEQTITVNAVGPHGGRTNVTREFSPPAPVPPTILDADFHVLEVRAGGALWASGSNFAGMVGDGTFREPVSPVPLPTPTEVVSVGAGDGFSIVADADGAVWAWGDVGESDGSYVPMPRRVAGLAGIVAVSAGEDDALALDTAGGVWLWSYDAPHVRRVRDVPPMSAVADGAGAAVALDLDGHVWDLRATDAAGGRAPARIQGTPVVTAIAAGDDALFLDEDGAVWKWTQSAGAPLLRVALASAATAVSAGYEYSLALLDDGTICAWSIGQETPTGITAARVRDLDGIRSIVAGTGSSSFAVDSDGFLWKWDTFGVDGGDERPVLARRAFREGHLPYGVAWFATRRVRPR